MKIDLSKCRTKEEIEEALRPLGEHMQKVRSSFAKVFGGELPKQPEQFNRPVQVTPAKEE